MLLVCCMLVLYVTVPLLPKYITIIVSSPLTLFSSVATRLGRVIHLVPISTQFHGGKAKKVRLLQP